MLKKAWNFLIELLGGVPSSIYERQKELYRAATMSSIETTHKYVDLIDYLKERNPELIAEWEKERVKEDV